MAFEADLFAWLSAQSTITALVSDRIYPLVMPPKVTYPALVYQTITGDPVKSLRGGAGLAKPLIQITAWSTDHNQAAEVAEVVRLALDGFAGLMGASTVRACSARGARHDAEQDTVGADETLYSVQRDFLFSHEEDKRGE